VADYLASAAAPFEPGAGLVRRAETGFSVQAATAIVQTRRMIAMGLVMSWSFIGQMPETISLFRLQMQVKYNAHGN
jgi:hypothetical protein